jgi:hypothetical protein
MSKVSLHFVSCVWVLIRRLCSIDSGVVDASALVHAPALFSLDAAMGHPCVLLNVHERTLRHLCDLHTTLEPVVRPLEHELLIATTVGTGHTQVSAPSGPCLTLRI